MLVHTLLCPKFQIHLGNLYFPSRNSDWHLKIRHTIRVGKLSCKINSWLDRKKKNVKRLPGQLCVLQGSGISLLPLHLPPLLSTTFLILVFFSVPPSHDLEQSPIFHSLQPQLIFSAKFGISMGAVIHIQNKYKSKGIENILKIEIYLHNFCKPFYNVFLLLDFASIS